jgi:hypothetical protein
VNANGSVFTGAERRYLSESNDDFFERQARTVD